MMAGAAGGAGADHHVLAGPQGVEGGAQALLDGGVTHAAILLDGPYA